MCASLAQASREQQDNRRILCLLRGSLGGPAQGKWLCRCIYMLYSQWIAEIRYRGSRASESHVSVVPAVFLTWRAGCQQRLEQESLWRHIALDSPHSSPSQSRLSITVSSLHHSLVSPSHVLTFGLVRLPPSTNTFQRIFDTFSHPLSTCFHSYFLF